MSPTLILLPLPTWSSAHATPRADVRAAQAWLDQRMSREHYSLRQTLRPEFGTVVTIQDPQWAHLFLLAWSQQGARQIQLEDLRSPIPGEYVDQYIRQR